MMSQQKQTTLWTGILLSMPVLVVTLLLLFLNRDWDKHPPTAGSAIIAFGDSLVAGVGASEGNGWVPLVARELNVEIVNDGISGDTTATALDRLEKDVLTKDPRIVIVLLGGNDILKKIPREEMFENLEVIIDRIQDRGAAVLLIGVQGGLIGDSNKKDFKRLARDKGTWLILDILDGIFGDPNLMSDYIHPNDAGYAKVADRIAPVLREIIENKG